MAVRVEKVARGGTDAPRLKQTHHGAGPHQEAAQAGLEVLGRDDERLGRIHGLLQGEDAQLHEAAATALRVHPSHTR